MDKVRQGKARRGKARQGKARRGKARQGKARQGKARLLLCSAYCRKASTSALSSVRFVSQPAGSARPCSCYDLAVKKQLSGAGGVHLIVRLLA